MINYMRKTWQIVDNYVLSRWQKRPSPALFWYLPEKPRVIDQAALKRYQSSQPSPLYLLDYQKKLDYQLENAEGIIVLPYHGIGAQINPEAAFQYALALHDQYCLTKEKKYEEKLWHYIHFFKQQQTETGGWPYQFDWYGSKAPWYSALAQGRGAALMLRAYLLSHDEAYKLAAKKAVSQFKVPLDEGGFLHYFAAENCPYFEEYPHTPTGVLNGFMATLMNVWELQYWFKEAWLKELWHEGIKSLEKMLPHYSTSWWSLYDLDPESPIANVNSPRYHLLEINYLQILRTLSASNSLDFEIKRRLHQYQHFYYRQKALGLKLIRKVLYK